MRRIKALPIAICAAILCAAVGTSARADNWDRKTVVTFNNAVEIPGQVLPPGTYVFKLVNLPGSRNLVQIMNEDQSFTFTTLQTVSTYRWRAPDHTLFRLDERAGDSPEAIRTWYYPGDNRGVDFIYSYSNGTYPPTATYPGQ
ncbi:MAG TPA: hypothetical protein VNV41_11590 [Candidatus Acidoferrales bacterium]|jgi:hypothetical protein|nr:hypothetical protein [Candidatus Acidoferrales bacterium]